MANTTPNQAGQPAPQSRQPQGFAATPEAQQALAAVGFNLDQFLNLPWGQAITFIRALIDAFSTRQPVMRGAAGGAAGTDADHAAHLKAHFEAIQALARCGANCCDQG